MHGVRIHDPCHGLLVSIHVGSRDIFFRTNEFDQLGGVAAGDALQLPPRHLFWGAEDTTPRPPPPEVYPPAPPPPPPRSSAGLLPRDGTRRTGGAPLSAA